MARYIEPEAVELVRRLSAAGMGVVWDYDDDVVRPERRAGFDGMAAARRRRHDDERAARRALPRVRRPHRRSRSRTSSRAPRSSPRDAAHDGTVLGYIGWIDHQDDWDELGLREICEDLLDAHPDLRVESVGPIDLRLPAERYRGLRRRCSSTSCRRRSPASTSRSRRS